MTLNDNDWALTGSNSMGGIILPDTSRVILGSNTNVKVETFSQAAVASAKFYIYSGKVRFKVEHPSGARKLYVLNADSADRGARYRRRRFRRRVEQYPNQRLSVLSNPSLPVQVTLTNGQVFTLAAGRSA